MVKIPQYEMSKYTALVSQHERIQINLGFLRLGLKKIFEMAYFYKPVIADNIWIIDHKRDTYTQMAMGELRNLLL